MQYQLPTNPRSENESEASRLRIVKGGGFPFSKWPNQDAFLLLYCTQMEQFLQFSSLMMGDTKKHGAAAYRWGKYANWTTSFQASPTFKFKI